ncbi:Thymidylate kinase [Serratia symbiotica]|nr:Thymidylate kinase [Serratia symbiotica]
MKSKFIVIEGLEGSGKTTACDTVANLLREYSINDIVFTREPGGTPLAEELRNLIKHGILGDIPTINTEVLMLYAARVQLVETVIKPALIRGAYVVGDRHDLSSQAYQGGGRGINSKLLLLLHNFLLEGFYPNLTLYLDLPPLIGLQRVKKRNISDRIEQETLSFFIRTRAQYLALAEKDKSIIIIDATQSLKKVTISIRSHVSIWLKKQVNIYE